MTNNIENGYPQTRSLDDTRRLHLFDSFTGLPRISDSDTNNPHVINDSWFEGALTGLSADDLLAEVGVHIDPHKVHIHEGYFSQTLPQIDPTTRFALIHLDCDLYSSSFDVLDFLLKNNLVSEGCYLFLDDFLMARASPDKGMRAAFEKVLKKYTVEVTDVGGYGLFSKKVIIHSYRRN